MTSPVPILRTAAVVRMVGNTKQAILLQDLPIGTELYLSQAHSAASCVTCNDTREVDSGDIHPWGEAQLSQCPACEPEAAT